MLAIVLGSLLAITRPPDPTPAASGNDERFSHRHVTQASPQAVWSRWVDVTSWPQWDRELREAELRDPIGLGARGVLRPRRGPKARFRITEWEPGRRYAFTTRMPFATLTITRYLEPHRDGTAFVHEVRFEGLARRAFARRYGPTFRAALPEVMAALATLAEEDAR